MDISKYWKDIDVKLEELIIKGYVKLPPLDFFNLSTIAENISEDMKEKTFCELCSSHKVFLQELNLKKYLTPKLYEIASHLMGYTGQLENQYHIARRVEAGNTTELYRAHFDSHLFTLVLPIKIPKAQKAGSVGDLIYFPNARKRPKNEITNFLGKVYHKKYASKKGIDKFTLKHKKFTDDFQDYSPLLFIGNTTLHTNKSVSIDCSSYRLTLLSHFFDPSPKYGLGGLVRLLRAR